MHQTNIDFYRILSNNYSKFERTRNNLKYSNKTPFCFKNTVNPHDFNPVIYFKFQDFKLDLMNPLNRHSNPRIKIELLSKYNQNIIETIGNNQKKAYTNAYILLWFKDFNIIIGRFKKFKQKLDTYRSFCRYDNDR